MGYRRDRHNRGNDDTWLSRYGLVSASSAITMVVSDRDHQQFLYSSDQNQTIEKGARSVPFSINSGKYNLTINKKGEDRFINAFKFERFALTQLLIIEIIRNRSRDKNAIRFRCCLDTCSDIYCGADCGVV